MTAVLSNCQVVKPSQLDVLAFGLQGTNRSAMAETSHGPGTGSCQGSFPLVCCLASSWSPDSGWQPCGTSSVGQDCLLPSLLPGHTPFYLHTFTHLDVIWFHNMCGALDNRCGRLHWSKVMSSPARLEPLRTHVTEIPREVIWSDLIGLDLPSSCQISFITSVCNAILELCIILEKSPPPPPS